ncbi:MAG TPA: chorismate mutase [Polyangiaceae bacterium]
MKTRAAERLGELRLQIDALNDAFVALVSQRALVAGAIAELKREGGLDLHDPQRERDMLASLLASNPGPMSNELLGHLLGELFRTSRTHMADATTRQRATG